ncbi:hypothetical protein L9F63_019673 [Diploptera punctata]|uniref:Ionotropic glutamate receptor C-terminal domain-containing protein n=1 Tax=Diploptera punctata TaxID=6984 RepID=A0AAD8EDQ0_DIPPU|nr:hypothetical protein L9F63_019673 [Diploptera punctata]
MTSDAEFVRSIWLILFGTSTSVNAFFSEVYVPMDCEVIAVQKTNDAIQLTEVYNVQEEYPLQLSHFGQWTPEEGLTATKEPFCVRRSNMFGITMNVVTISDYPYITLTEFPNGTSAVTGGYFGVVWFVFESKLNFSTRYTALDTGLEAHIVNNTKTDPYTKMVDEVRLQKYDVGLAATRFIRDRFDLVDYSYLIHRSKYVIVLTSGANADVAWEHFFGPFQPTLWFAVIGCILLIAGCLSAFYYLGRRLAYPEYENKDQYNFFVSVFYVFSMFCQQGHDVTPKSCACRLVYWLGYVIAVVVLAAYSATLISFLTINSTEPHVKSLKALVKDGSYKMGMLPQYLRMIKTNADNGITKQMYQKMIAPDPKNIPSTSLEGLQRVCSTKYAFWTSVEELKRVGDAVDCNIAILPKYSYMFNLAYVIRDHNPYRKFLNFL